jgi:hypothetical protein
LGRTAIEGESTKLDTSRTASVETTTSLGSGLVDQQELLASGKGVYSLHYLENTKNVCGVSIGDKTNASFCLKAAGTCTVTQHSSRGKSLWCKANRLYLQFSKQGQHRVSELAIEPKEVSYALEFNADSMVNEFEDLECSTHLATWNEDLNRCKSRDKAVVCFHAFSDSAALMKDEAAANESEAWNAIAVGNGDPFEEEEEDNLSSSEDDDLSEDSEVRIVVDDGSEGRDKVEVLVKELTATVKNLAVGLQRQAKEIVSLRSHLGGMRIEIVEQLENTISKDEWPDYRRDSYSFVNKKSRLLLGCSEVSGTVEKLIERVGELEMGTEDRVVHVPVTNDPALLELQESLAKQDDEIYLLKSRLGSDSVQFGSVNLKSLADTYLFVNSEMTESNTSFGCFFDLVALMDSVMDSGTGMTEYLKNSSDSRKIDHNTVAEARTASSFNRTTPTIFTGSGNTTLIQAGTIDRLFSAVKKRDCWTSVGGSQGLKRVWERG